MSDTVIVAIVSGLFTILVTAITVWAGIRKQAQQSAVQQAILETEMKELTREVRLHNEFANRIPRIEARIDTLEEKVKNAKAG